MKKTILIGLTASMLCSMNFVSAANNQNIKTKVYDEGVIISGYLPDAAVGDEVLITVLNRNIDIDTFDKYEELEDIIVYQDETKVDEKNEYEFLLKTKSGGKHYAYVASGAYSEIMTGEYSYISKTVYDNIPKNSKIDLYEYMKSNRNLMGLDEDYYTDDVIACMAEILFNSKEENGYSEETLTEDIEKSFVIAMLNDETIDDVKEYKNMLNLTNESDITYFPTSGTKEFTKEISGKDFKNINEFEEALHKSIILYTVNTSSESKIKAIITENKDIFGDVTISNAMAEYLKEATPFYDTEEVKDKILAYKPDNNKGSGGSGGNGGGGGKSNPSLPMITPGAVVQTSQEKQEFSPFDDTEGVSWAKEAIEGLYHKGIINGKEERKFYPFDNITRNEFAKIVTGAFDFLSLVDEYFPFADVSESHWAYPYVKTAYLAGITNGYSDNYFGGDEFITRQDLCVMVYRAFNACDIEITGNADKVLLDENEISDYAKDAVKAMVRCGIISGDENSRFNPKKNASRAEAAKILYYAMSMIK